MRTTWILAALLAAGPLYAQEAIDETRSLAADALVVVKNLKGEVVIRSSSGNKMRVTGTLGEGSEELSITEAGSRLVVEVRNPRNARNLGNTNLEILLPEGASVEVETVSADALIDGLRGALVAVTTVSGQAEVTADPEEVELKTVSGDIQLRTNSRRVELKTVSGDIESDELSGNLTVSTVSGEVLISGRDLERVHFETVSGDLELELAMAAHADVNISSLSGDVELAFAEGLSADVGVTTFSGSIRSDRGEVEKARHGPQKSLSFRAGDGSSRVRIESFSGDVRIRTR